MARQYEIDIVAKADKAVKEIESLKKQIEELTQKVAENNQTTKDGLDDISDSSKNTAKGIKSIGTSIKAAGIGIALALFAQLKDIFSQNQKVLDGFNTALEFLSLAFNDFFNFISNNVGTVVNYFKAIFDDPVDSLYKLGDSIVNLFINRFKQAGEVLEKLGEGFSLLFKGRFVEANLAFKQAAIESIDVFTGVDNTLEKTADTITKVASSITDYTKKTFEGAVANVELNKQAEVASVINQGLIEKYDRQAEQQRQIRDEERNTIEERIAANNKLGEILDEQAEKMLDNVDITIKAAQAEYNKNQNQENLIRLLEAQNEKQAVLAQIEGFRSEQKMNDLALEREAIELTQSRIDSSTELAIEEAKFYAEQETNEVLRIQNMRMAFEMEYNLELQRLEDKKSLYKEGTLAYQEAENEINALNQRAVQERMTFDKDEFEAKKLLQEENLQVVSDALSGVAALVGENSKVGKAIAVAQATIDTYVGANKALAQGGIFGAIGAAGIIAGGLANVRTILKTDVPGSPSISGAAPTPPSFNIVGASPENQLAEAIGNRQQKPIKAYVVSNEVTTQQALDRKIETSASIG